MPKDKTETNSKIIRYIREEFMTYGYEKASLNRVSAKVGITTAGLYKHFKNKEDMFRFLVKDTLDDFAKVNSGDIELMETQIDYNPFDSDRADFWVDFICDHFEGLQLLICCSKGSPYESFEEDLINMETEANVEYARLLSEKNGTDLTVSDMQWHILATAYIHLVFEIVRHKMTKDQAREHMRFIRDLLYPGWKQLLGIK